MNQDHTPHVDAATAARRLIDDTPGSAAMEPEERERLQQTIERIITRARRLQRVHKTETPWATSYQAQTGRTARRGDEEDAL